VRLKEKTAIITGAGAGIGRESALLFAREGAKVACVDLDAGAAHDAASAVLAAGGQAAGIQADAADDQQVGAAVHKVMDLWGRLDIFFANAGIVPAGTVLECSVDEWEKAMSVNSRSVFLACRHAIPSMRRSGGGSIICTSSVAGLVGVKNRAAYSASKMAVIGLVKSVAIDYVAEGIRINAICPGTVDTPSLQARLHATGDYSSALQEFISRQPMGRLGNASEIAALALYLASPESAYMTGSHLVIDGGLSL